MTVTRRTPLAKDVQDVLLVLGAHTDDVTRAIVERVLAGEATEGTLHDIQRALDARRSLRGRARSSWYVLAALEQITWVDVWRAHISDNGVADLDRQARSWLEIAGAEVDVLVELVMPTPQEARP